MTHFSAKIGKFSDILDFYEDSNESAEIVSNEIKSILVGNGLSLNNLAYVSYGKYNSVLRLIVVGTYNMTVLYLVLNC